MTKPSLNDLPISGHYEVGRTDPTPATTIGVTAANPAIDCSVASTDVLSGSLAALSACQEPLHIIWKGAVCAYNRSDLRSYVSPEFTETNIFTELGCPGPGSQPLPYLSIEGTTGPFDTIAALTTPEASLSESPPVKITDLVLIEPSNRALPDPRGLICTVDTAPWSVQATNAYIVFPPGPKGEPFAYGKGEHSHPIVSEDAWTEYLLKVTGTILPNVRETLTFVGLEGLDRKPFGMLQISPDDMSRVVRADFGIALNQQSAGSAYRCTWDDIASKVKMMTMEEFDTLGMRPIQDKGKVAAAL